MMEMEIEKKSNYSNSQGDSDFDLEPESVPDETPVFITLFP